MITSLQNPRVKNAVHLRDARQRQAQGAHHHRRCARVVLRRVGRSACNRGFRLRTAASQRRHPGTRQHAETDRRRNFACRRKRYLTRWPSEAGPKACWEWPKCRTKPWMTWMRSLSVSTRGAEHVAKNPLVAVLEGVEKPGNIGAVSRSADAAGVSALILCRRPHRPLQSQRHTGKPGHDLYHARVRSDKR